MGGRRPGENNKSQGHDRVHQLEAGAKRDIWEKAAHLTLR